jgi:hypothetical protein
MSSDLTASLPPTLLPEQDHTHPKCSQILILLVLHHQPLLVPTVPDALETKADAPDTFKLHITFLRVLIPMDPTQLHIHHPFHPWNRLFTIKVPSPLASRHLHHMMVSTMPTLITSIWILIIPIPMLFAPHLFHLRHLFLHVTDPMPTLTLT